MLWYSLLQVFTPQDKGQQKTEPLEVNQKWDHSYHSYHEQDDNVSGLTWMFESKRQDQDQDKSKTKTKNRSLSSASFLLPVWITIHHLLMSVCLCLCFVCISVSIPMFVFCLLVSVCVCLWLSICLPYKNPNYEWTSSVCSESRLPPLT